MTTRAPPATRAVRHGRGEAAGTAGDENDFSVNLKAFIDLVIRSWCKKAL